jgi:hypothetical protein
MRDRSFWHAVEAREREQRELELRDEVSDWHTKKAQERTLRRAIYEAGRAQREETERLARAVREAKLQDAQAERAARELADKQERMRDAAKKLRARGLDFLLSN